MKVSINSNKSIEVHLILNRFGFMKGVFRNSVAVFLFFIVSCQTQKDKPIKTIKKSNISPKEIIKQDENRMSNPIMLSDAGGADIGRLFNAYYRTGQQQKMLVLLDSMTKKTYSNEELVKLLSKLDFGYDMKLSGASQKENSFVLTYSCQIAQSKVVKQLKVVIENDTARIAPKNLMNGELFQ